MRNVWPSIISVILAVLSSAIPANAEDSGFGNDLDAQWNKMEAKANADYTAYEKHEIDHWRDYQKRVKQKWADGAIPEQKSYVQYLEDDTSRIKVDYENGTVTVEALFDPKDGSQGNAKQKIQEALSSVIAKDSGPGSIIAKDEMEPQAATIVSEEATMAGDGKPRMLYRMSLKMVPDYIKRRAAKFKPLVDAWATKYRLDPAYILSIMRQESSFNPRARSWCAFGLLQIVPKFAGIEVMKAVTGKATLPDSEFLYDPDKNIMIGATYLQLLRDQYFPEVKDDAKRLYIMTASYNWGPHRIKTAIAKGRLPASASSADTFDIIQKIAPEETRNYVRKVSEFFIEFKKGGL